MQLFPNDSLLRPDGAAAERCSSCGEESPGAADRRASQASRSKRFALPGGYGWLLLAAGLAMAAPMPAPSAEPRQVREIMLLHFSHTDFGFTDHPSVCREYYPRFLDLALDGALATMNGPEDRKFRWTAESTVPVADWWRQAPPERRRQFLRAARAGQLEVAAMPFNNTPFLDRHQWDRMLHWLPEDLWVAVQPRTAIQNDVNGLPRAGAMRLLDRGIRYLFTGINEDSGGVPFRRPSAFWWKMPDGRRLFVWLNTGYGSGFDFFEAGEWRRGPVPRAADTQYRPPRAGDFLRTDEAYLRQAHARCLSQVRHVEQAGYTNAILTISITSQWRFDNDPPFLPMADFVSAWNRLGLEPRLRLATVTTAMRELEASLGAHAPEYEGEWTDWWANGTASAPQEVAASRQAKRNLAAAQSPVWGALDPATRERLDDLYHDLSLFDEHTWGSSMSVALPYSLDTLGQFNEKARLAYRPMAMSEWLLARRARVQFTPGGEGLWLVNPADAPYTGWVSLTRNSLRSEALVLQDSATGILYPLQLRPAIQPWGRATQPSDFTRENVSSTFPDNVPGLAARFWVSNLAAHGARHFRLRPAAAAAAPPASQAPTLECDPEGWPTAVRWPGMDQPLFGAGLGEVTVFRCEAFAPRSALGSLWGQPAGPERDAQLRKLLPRRPSRPEGSAQREENPHTIAFTQPLAVPGYEWATRRLEIWKQDARARLTLRMNRQSSFLPEVTFVSFPLPCANTLPRFSSGGQPFTPFADQLPNTCRDYFAIDGWAEYLADAGRWLWVSRDAPLVSLGEPRPLARINAAPAGPGRLNAMVYNNVWYTNFRADTPGIMEFQFDLVWSARSPGNAPSPAALAEALVTEPVVIVNPALKEDPRVVDRLYRF